MDLIDPVEFRKFQENISNMKKMGYFKQTAEFHKDLYNAYVAAGFDAKEALELLKVFVSK